jgi:hypothetical protein
MQKNNLTNLATTRWKYSPAAKHSVVIVFLLATLLSVSAMAQAASISVGSASGLPGASVTLSVGFIPSATAAASLQFDLMFASSLTYSSCSVGSAITAAGKLFSCNAISGGIRVLTYGGINAIGEGNVADVQLNISGSASAGSIPVTIGGIVVSDANGDQIAFVGNAGSVTVLALADTTAPVITITSPTSGSTYSTSSSTLTLGGTASDSVGVTQVTWTNSRGGSGAATGTTTWSASGVALQSGSNVITVTAKDAANNSGTSTLTVTYTPADTTAPAITITSPTSGSTYSTASSTLTLGGTASDSVGVTQVTWTNNRGGNGTATGTTTWTASGVALQNGSNVITVTAKDAANNSGTGTLTVTYIQADSTPPAISNVFVSRLPVGSATIVWATDELSDSQVEFGTSNSYGGSVSSTASVTSHSLALNGLSPRTFYHYRVKSKDATGNSAVSADYTFTAAATNIADFNGDLKSEILWRNISTGEVSISPLTGNGASSISLGVVSDLSWKIAGVGDFNGDGKPDILWRHYDLGDNYIWFMNGTNHTDGIYLEAQKDLDYKIVGVGDFNGDGKPDILWMRRSMGTYSVWFMDGTSHFGGADLAFPSDINWQVAGVADFDGDGNSDVLWRNNATGECRIELMNRTAHLVYRDLPGVADPNWMIVAIGDYNGDGQFEILLKNSLSGNYLVWYMAGTVKISEEDLGRIRESNIVANSSQAVAGFDLNQDGSPDILWPDTASGDSYLWLMDWTNNGGVSFDPAADHNWKIAAADDVNNDGRLDLLWRNQSTGECAAWYMNGTVQILGAALPSMIDANWKVIAAVDFDNDGKVDLLWRNTATGQDILWLMNKTSRLGETTSGSGQH